MRKPLSCSGLLAFLQLVLTNRPTNAFPLGSTGFRRNVAVAPIRKSSHTSGQAIIQHNILHFESTRRNVRRMAATDDASSKGMQDGTIDDASNVPARPAPSPLLQFAVVLLLYFFHLLILTQNELVFPVQLIPNDKGHFTGIGWDSVAGIATLIIYQGRQRRLPRVSTAPQALSSDDSSASDCPWRLPKERIRFRLTTFLASCLLVLGYFWTGRFSWFWQDFLYDLSGLGWYITTPMYRSLTVLLGHLSWVAMGVAILRWLPRPPKFFLGKDERLETKKETSATGFRWFTGQIRGTNWMWWTIGGYFISSMLFNMADLTNQYVLPLQVLEDAQESVVTQLINPEHNNVAASLVGFVAPCISAPWWEEILYRGFALPAFTQMLGFPWAVFVQGIIFSAHHMSLTSALPLAVLGWTWAVVYRKSNNLWTVVFIHALWNSRVFLGSWLGL